MTAAPQFLDQLDWVAEGARPAGQPGTVRGAWEYPAVQTTTGHVVFWRDGQMFLAPTELARTFTPGPEWKSRCTHRHDIAWWTCQSAAQCDALAMEEEQ